MPKTSTHFFVAPRYTGGSPGIVDESTAQRIAKEEESAYHDALKGRDGARARETAALRGLDGIAVKATERQDGFDRLDLITGLLTRREDIRAKNLRLGDEIVYTVEGGGFQNLVKITLLHVTPKKVQAADAHGNAFDYRPMQMVKVQRVLPSSR